MIDTCKTRQIGALVAMSVLINKVAAVVIIRLVITGSGGEHTVSRIPLW